MEGDNCSLQQSPVDRPRCSDAGTAAQLKVTQEARGAEASHLSGTPCRRAEGAHADSDLCCSSLCTMALGASSTASGMPCLVVLAEHLGSLHGLLASFLQVFA